VDYLSFELRSYDGSVQRPTLSGEIQRSCGWSGALRAGVWEAIA
jgi:hypothetical protein